MKSTTKIPEDLKSYYPKNGYHVRMNRNYTATIRSLTDFQNYINSKYSDIDMDVFGEITSADKSASDDFKYVLNTIIAEVKGFAVFNAQFKHTYIECTALILRRKPSHQLSLLSILLTFLLLIICS